MAFDERLRRRVKAVCCAQGARLTELIGYYNFALQVDNTRKRVHGNDLAVVAAALVERYVKLGLERRVLEAVREQVFGVRSPAAT